MYMKKTIWILAVCAIVCTAEMCEPAGHVNFSGRKLKDSFSLRRMLSKAFKYNQADDHCVGGDCTFDHKKTPVEPVDSEEIDYEVKKMKHSDDAEVDWESEETFGELSVSSDSNGFSGKKYEFEESGDQFTYGTEKNSRCEDGNCEGNFDSNVYGNHWSQTQRADEKFVNGRSYQTEISQVQGTKDSKFHDDGEGKETYKSKTQKHQDIGSSGGYSNMESGNVKTETQFGGSHKVENDAHVDCDDGESDCNYESTTISGGQTTRNEKIYRFDYGENHKDTDIDTKNKFKSVEKTPQQENDCPDGKCDHYEPASKTHWKNKEEVDASSTGSSYDSEYESNYFTEDNSSKSIENWEKSSSCEYGDCEQSSEAEGKNTKKDFSTTTGYEIDHEISYSEGNTNFNSIEKGKGKYDSHGNYQKEFEKEYELDADEYGGDYSSEYGSSQTKGTTIKKSESTGSSEKDCEDDCGEYESESTWNENSFSKTDRDVINYSNRNDYSDFQKSTHIEGEKTGSESGKEFKKDFGKKSESKDHETEHKKEDRDYDPEKTIYKPVYNQEKSKTTIEYSEQSGSYDYDREVGHSNEQYSSSRNEDKESSSHYTCIYDGCVVDHSKEKNKNYHEDVFGNVIKDWREVSTHESSSDYQETTKIKESSNPSQAKYKEKTNWERNSAEQKTNERDERVQESEVKTWSDSSDKNKKVTSENCYGPDCEYEKNSQTQTFGINFSDSDTISDSESVHNSQTTEKGKTMYKSKSKVPEDDSDCPGCYDPEPEEKWTYKSKYSKDTEWDSQSKSNEYTDFYDINYEQTTTQDSKDKECEGDHCDFSKTSQSDSSFKKIDFTAGDTTKHSSSKAEGYENVDVKIKASNDPSKFKKKFSKESGETSSSYSTESTDQNTISYWQGHETSRSEKEFNCEDDENCVDFSGKAEGTSYSKTSGFSDIDSTSSSTSYTYDSSHTKKTGSKTIN